MTVLVTDIVGWTSRLANAGLGPSPVEHRSVSAVLGHVRGHS
jgi:hypothetical protein